MRLVSSSFQPCTSAQRSASSRHHDSSSRFFASVSSNRGAPGLRMMVRKSLTFPEQIKEIGAPKSLLTGIIAVLQKPIMFDPARVLMRRVLIQNCWIWFFLVRHSSAEFCPLGRDFRTDEGVHALGFCGIARSEASLLFALAEKRAEILRDSFAEEVNPGFRMFDWTRHG